MEKLNAYSQRFAEVLFGTFPEWKQFAAVQKADNADKTGFLLVKVPAAAKGLIVNNLILERGDFLRIDTDEGIIVGFDYHHTHFDNFDFLTEEENFTNAIEFIKDIVDEKICFLAVFSETAFCGSSSILAGEKPDLSGWNWLHQSCQDVYLRSWLGTYNRKYRISELREET
jgi:hypothetical protein